jgi:hypothetical protein
MRIDSHRIWSLLGAFAGSLVAVTSQAQVLQLPTYSYFSTDSSVLVPDRGAAMLGGVSRSSSGSNQFGPPFFPPSQSNGSSRGASVSSVTAQIHDMDDMDRAVLAQAARAGNGARSPRGLAPGADAAGTPGAAQEPQYVPAPVASVADLAARKAAADAAQEQEGERLVAKAREAIAAGKTGAAKVYLQMAARRATGPRKTQILALMQAMDPKAPVAAAR